ncbi:hypothetical protein SMD44_07770 [Streptomyces alboflavus]|uniref:Uncharacterized protein n=1 Tax=Streptomyces alboflavus TaxID=67267 RepID=A0A1Z1WPD2_9ACTN|nr:hypothetical protein SMD44_07770 [Streptomyces alboflavus]
MRDMRGTLRLVPVPDVGGFGAAAFDTDADFGTAGLGGVPVTLAASYESVIAWLGSLTGSVLIASSGLTEAARFGRSVPVPPGPLAGWRATRVVVGEAGGMVHSLRRTSVVRRVLGGALVGGSVSARTAELRSKTRSVDEGRRAHD